MKVLGFRDVTRTFPGPVPIEVSKTYSFTTNDGDMVTIVGHSGFDRSTLLDLAELLDRPSSGAVLINDLDTTRLSESDRTALRGSSIGFVLQVFRLMPHRSVAGNVILARFYQGVPIEERKEAPRRTIDLVSLDHRSDSPVKLLSGGERQRVTIIRAMVINPVILLCDEPTGNLDNISSEAIIDLPATLNGAETTVVIITHNPEIASVRNLRLQLHDGIVTRGAV